MSAVTTDNMSITRKIDGYNFVLQSVHMELINIRNKEIAELKDRLKYEVEMIDNSAKDEIESLQAKLKVAVRALEEIEQFMVLSKQDICLPMEIAREALKEIGEV